jgi:hypothetical protein
MYKILMILVLMTTFLKASFSQSNGEGPSTQLANRIADKMRDSLSLSEKQRNEIFVINTQLQNKKKAARASGQNRESIGLALQQIENTRDSLYATVLSASEILVYKQKKRNLIRNN